MAEQLEEWRPVEGWEDVYEVSSLGRVRSLARTRRGPFGCRIRVSERILRAAPQSTGYLHVCLAHDGRRAFAMLHRLVAAAFLPPSHGKGINHRDGDKSNNAVANLEWGTHLENMRHASLHGLLGTRANGRHRVCRMGV